MAGMVQEGSRMFLKYLNKFQSEKSKKNSSGVQTNLSSTVKIKLTTFLCNFLNFSSIFQKIAIYLSETPILFFIFIIS